MAVAAWLVWRRDDAVVPMVLVGNCSDDGRHLAAFHTRWYSLRTLSDVGELRRRLELRPLAAERGEGHFLAFPRQSARDGLTRCHPSSTPSGNEPRNILS